MFNQFLNNNYKNLFIGGFCVFIVLFSFSKLNAQNNINERKILRQARKYLAKENFSLAQEKYMQLVNASPKNSVYNFEAGLSYYNSTYQRNKSIPLFEAAVENINPDDEVIPEMYYYLAKSYQLNSEFEKSNETFEKFNPYINQKIKPGRELLEAVTDENNYNKNGIKYQGEEKNDIKITNIGSNVNSLDREYAPVLHKAENVLLFTSRRKINGNKIANDLLPYEDIYVAKKIDNGWILLSDQNEIKKYLPANVNTKKHDASITYSLDGKTLYTYKKDAIWQSKFENDSWSNLEKLNDNVNASKFNVPSVTLTPDGNTLFFVATRKDGIGEKDIYKSTKNANGDWEEPTLLSTNINTTKDEDGPYLTEDGKTLFFSSRGHTSMGGYDIFKSELVNNEWSTPINLGIPINSPADDIFYISDSEQKNGFFSSSREGGHGAFDIYAFSSECENLKNTEIRGIVYDNTNKSPVNSNLTLIEKSSGNEINKTDTKENGVFLLVAPPENNYQLIIKAEGFEEQILELSLNKQCDYFQLFTEIALEQIEIEDKYVQVATLKNSFFNIDEEITNFKTSGGVLAINQVASELPFTNNKDQEAIAFSKTIEPNNTTLNFSIISDTISINQITEPIVDASFPSFDNIQFDFDKSIINGSNKKIMDEVIEYLKSEKGKNIQVTISGHTDGKRDMELNKKIFAKRNIPFTIEESEKRSKEYNLELSKKRANAAAKYLISKGINKNSIVVNYYGEEKPIAPNFNADGSENKENQALNRRVTFSFSHPNIL